MATPGAPFLATAPPPRLTDDQLGVIAVTLALGFPFWLQRRVEQVTYLDDITVAHHEGVMIRWPEPEFFPDAARPRAGQTIYVPLGLLTKGPLTGLDGTQPDGSPFPIMVSGRTRGLASSGITTLIWGLSEKVRGHGLEDEASLRIIDAIVTGPAALARTLLRTLDDPSAELGQVLPRITELRGLLQELGESVSLLAPALYRPGSEDVYRYTYSRPLPWESSGLGAAFGFADTRARVRELSLGQSASYHLAVEAPAEVRLAHARLYGMYARNAGLVTALVAEDGGSPGCRPARPASHRGGDGDAGSRAPAVTAPAAPHPRAPRHERRGLGRSAPQRADAG